MTPPSERQRGSKKAALPAKQPKREARAQPRGKPAPAKPAPKHAPPKVRSTDSLLTAVSDLCHDPVITAGPDGRIASWNPAAERLFGYAAAEAVGMPIGKLVPQDIRIQHDEGFKKHVKQKTSQPFGRTIFTRARRKDGTEVPIEVSLGVGNAGSRQMFTAVIRDVTEHRALVERLNDALQRLQFHVERMPLAYIVWTADFRVLEWNPAAERIFGYSRAEATGRDGREMLVPRDVIPTVDAIWADLLAGDTSSHSINENLRKDGSRITCEWFNTPLRDSQGRIHGVASMAMDVSEREALESQIRHTQKLESLGVMAAGIAHDFNSSLMVMLGNAALLRAAKGLPATAAERLDLIEEAGQRAGQLIKHMLAYARTGRHNPQSTDVNKVIREAGPFVRSSIGTMYTLQLELADSLPVVNADRSQIEQILLNLCMNAREAMPDGGTVTVTTGETRLSPAQIRNCIPHDVRPGRYVEIVVRDTGGGMDEVTQSRIFDPFFTTKPDGHGLGLAAVLGILRQHKAAIRVVSARGKGAAMHVYFPVAV